MLGVERSREDGLGKVIEDADTRAGLQDLPRPFRRHRTGELQIQRARMRVEDRHADTGGRGAQLRRAEDLAALEEHLGLFRGVAGHVGLEAPDLRQHVEGDLARVDR